MKFTFRLEKVLQIARQRERQKMLELATRSRELEELQSKKKALGTSIREMLMDQATTLKQGTQWLPFQVTKINIDLKAEFEIDHQIEKKRREIETKRAEVMHLVRRRRALELVREKRFEQYRLDESRKEQKRLDETHQLLRARK